MCFVCLQGNTVDVELTWSHSIIPAKIRFILGDNKHVASPALQTVWQSNLLLILNEKVMRRSWNMKPQRCAVVLLSNQTCTRANTHQTLPLTLPSYSQHRLHPSCLSLSSPTWQHGKQRAKQPCKPWNCLPLSPPGHFYRERRLSADV